MKSTENGGKLNCEELVYEEGEGEKESDVDNREDQCGRQKKMGRREEEEWPGTGRQEGLKTFTTK